MFDPEEFDSALDDLEVRLERLNLRYERFFSGSERTEPAALREEIDHQLAQLLVEQKHIGPLTRVRLTLVQQRYDGYQQSWKRLAARAGTGALGQKLLPRASVPPVERATRVLREPSAHSEKPPPLASSQHLVTPVTGLDGSFARSSRPPAGRVLTPPLGTPATSPIQAVPVAESSLERASRAARPESSRTIRDFRQPLAREAPRPAADSPAPGPRPSLARAGDVSRATPGVSAVSEALAADSSSAKAAIFAEAGDSAPDHASSSREGPGVRAMSMERVREIHARLRASNGRPPSLERLAKRLSETEAKLKALHGDRTVTFDVILRDGKAIVKPIVH